MATLAVGNAMNFDMVRVRHGLQCMALVTRLSTTFFAAFAPLKLRVRFGFFIPSLEGGLLLLWLSLDN